MMDRSRIRNREAEPIIWIKLEMVVIHLRMLMIGRRSQKAVCRKIKQARIAIDWTDRNLLLRNNDDHHYFMVLLHKQ